METFDTPTLRIVARNDNPVRVPSYRWDNERSQFSAGYARIATRLVYVAAGKSDEPLGQVIYTTGRHHESCVAVTFDGSYRFEAAEIGIGLEGRDAAIAECKRRLYEEVTLRRFVVAAARLRVMAR